MIERRATFRVRPGAVAEAVAAIEAFVGDIATGEPGTTEYRSYQDADDPTRFVHTMTFIDEAARQVHISTEHVRDFVATLYPLCIDEPEFTDVRTVADRARKA